MTTELKIFGICKFRVLRYLLIITYGTEDDNGQQTNLDYDSFMNNIKYLQ